MLSQQRIDASFDCGAALVRRAGALSGDEADTADDENEGGGGGLEDAAREEREYLRGRLRDDLKREPTEAELNEWLRRHTEGY